MNTELSKTPGHTSGASLASPLTPPEQRKLLQLEEVIAKGLRTFLDVGRALLDIREARLYRGQYPSFEDYTRERWAMSKTHANRLILSATTVSGLGEVAVLPANESQVRPLTQLPSEEQATAWEKAVRMSGGKITAATVQSVVDDLLAKGKAKIHSRPVQVRWVDRDRLVRDLRAWAVKQKIAVPKEVYGFLQKY